MTDFDTAPTTAIEDLSGDYEFDIAHTRIGFAARHAMVTSVRGAFNEFEGTAHLDAADPSRSSARVVLKVASIDTGSEQRDGHLRSADFFDVETYPETTFVATGFERVDDEEFRVTGDLTVKDVTKPVTVDLTFNGSARDPFGNLRAGFEGTATVNRKDWGLTWNAALETGGFLVSDKIKLEFDVSAVKLTASA
ncbi:MAG TPA: YceI family protein [Mycobacteriales bacterium]|jgi:polyisoprenoid-binding protein YceI|nr:YceI family protein [Mycobacteriales bacterium]